MVCLAWLIVIQLLQVTYNVADMFWLIALSSDAVGALSLAFPLIFFLISISGGFTAAGNILVAQHIGAGSEDEASAVARQTLSFVSVVALVTGVMLAVSFVAALFRESLVAAFLTVDTPRVAETIEHGDDYLRIMAVMFVFMGVLQVALGAFRGAGNNRTSLAFSMVTLWVARVPTTYYSSSSRAGDRPEFGWPSRLATSWV